MGKRFVTNKIVDAAGSTRFVIPCAKNEARNTRLSNGSRAHHTRLERDHESVSGEVCALQGVPRESKRDDLRVSSRIVITLLGVTRHRHDHTCGINHHGGDRNITGGKCVFGVSDGLPHPRLIRLHTPTLPRTRRLGIG